MIEYRAYIINSDGHIRTFEVVVADDDNKALDFARSLVDGCDVEVWHLDRKVGLLRS